MAEEPAAADRPEDELERAWLGPWTALGLTPPAGLFRRLLRAYAERHRAYHTIVHVGECLDHIASAAALLERRGEVELAVWFHDAVYSTVRRGNEERSAAWARSVLVDAGASPGTVLRVSSMIAATRTHEHASSTDMAVLLDADLAILGAPAPRFAEYERQIRKEYWWIPRGVYARKRAEALEVFARRPFIYQTELFRERLETAARRNLAAAVSSPAR
jgi:predicted metal-dependent HD superfamily phosphohydrolase